MSLRQTLLLMNDKKQIKNMLMTHRFYGYRDMKLYQSLFSDITKISNYMKCKTIYVYMISP